MPCGCAGESYVDTDDLDATLLWREANIKATKREHRCVECDDPIPTGSRCCAFSGLCDGRFFREYRCLTCAALVEFINTKHEVCVNVLGALRDACDDFGIDWRAWRKESTNG